MYSRITKVRSACVLSAALMASPFVIAQELPKGDPGQGGGTD